MQAIYEWIARRYGLSKGVYRVRRLRMRPGNFPAVRLSQLAMLLFSQPDLAALVSPGQSLFSPRQKLMVTATGVRQRMFFRQGRKQLADQRLGTSMADNLLINVVIPLLFWRGRQEPDLVELAAGWLRQIHSEKNALVRTLGQAGFGQQDAFDSQAIIELKTQYCDKRRCLECAVGYSILNPMHPNQP
jgi:hypothetical protein